MSFMGLFAVNIILTFIIIGVLIASSVVFLIVSLVLKRKYTRKLAEADGNGNNPRKWYLVPGGIAVLGFAVLAFMILESVFRFAFIVIEESTSLADSVNSGNYVKAEQLLKKGVDPDCTIESNRPAKNGERTLLMELCRNNGFADELGYPVDYELTAEEVAMIELLIEYGADVNAESYDHERDDRWHRYISKSDMYRTDDECGYTPLMYAVRYGNTELVKLLIEKGADVNKHDYCGFTPVAIVADNLRDDEGAEILRILMENGAAVDVTTNFRQSTLFLANRNTLDADSRTNEEIFKILNEACKNERND